MLDLERLKDMKGTDIVQKLNESMARLKHFLRSKEEQHNSDEFIFDLTCVLARVCLEPIDENVIKILTALKGSIFYQRDANLLNRNQRNKSGRKRKLDPSCESDDDDELELCSHFSDEEFYEGSNRLFYCVVF